MFSTARDLICKSFKVRTSSYRGSGRSRKISRRGSRSGKGPFFKNWGLIKQSVFFLFFIIHISEVFEKIIYRFWDWKCEKKNLHTNQFFPIFWKYRSPQFLGCIKKRPSVEMFEVSFGCSVRRLMVCESHILLYPSCLSFNKNIEFWVLYFRV